MTRAELRKLRGRRVQVNETKYPKCRLTPGSTILSEPPSLCSRKSPVFYLSGPDALSPSRAMMLNDQLDRLRAVAEHLPFDVDDYEAANAAFCRWTVSSTEADHQVVDIWLYCYVQRYVLLRLLRDQTVAAGEADRIIEYVFMRARGQLDRIEEPERFAQWVSVVCKNSFLNGLRRRFTRTALDEAALLDEGTESSASAMADLDRDLVRHTVRRAISRLPDALQPVAELRLLEGRSYKHIAAATEHPLPTVRTYMAKALTRLRGDPALQMLARSLDFLSEPAGTHTSPSV
jgi:RNA polymerase sigma factor (sigma-70 family)